MEHHEDKLRQCKCSMVCKMNCKRAVVQWVPQNFRFSSPISKLKWEKRSRKGASAYVQKKTMRQSGEWMLRVSFEVPAAGAPSTHRVERP